MGKASTVIEKATMIMLMMMIMMMMIMMVTSTVAIIPVRTEQVQLNDCN